MHPGFTAVSDDQLGSLSEVIGEGDVKELIGSALTGKRADAPTSVLGKFGAALGGAGGIGNLVPTPQLPPIGMPPGGSGGYGPGGFPPQPGTSTEEGSSSGEDPRRGLQQSGGEISSGDR